MKCKLSDICDFAKEKVDVSSLNTNSYISTENMLPNKGGITQATTLPSTIQTQAFSVEDTLVSNIRPYFKKIWYAQSDGGCSNDVLVFRHKKNVHPRFLYYILADDKFFDYATATSKGTKMPRGDKQAIMDYAVPNIPWGEQCKIVDILSNIDDKIATNTAINKNLESQAQAIFKSWFVDFEPFGGEMPRDWKLLMLGDVSIMGAGGDKPEEVSEVKTDKCPYPIYSNGLSEDGLYGYTNDYKISVESVTVSARGTIGFVCLRHIPYTPIVRLITLIPYTDIVSSKYLYLWLKNTYIAGTGTTQQQLTVPAFKKTEILIPTKNEMKSFTTRINPLFEKIWENQKENEKLAALRDTLLPRLMSGEIDVGKVEV